MKRIYAILTFVLALGTMVSCSKEEAPKSSLNSITEFLISFDATTGVTADDIQYQATGTEINITVPYGTGLTGVTSAIKIPEKATILPASGTKINFEDGVAKQFVVTAEDGTQKTYNVTVTTRGEVGSGTKLKKLIEENGLYATTTTYDFTYNDANLVSKYNKTEGENVKEFVFKYNSKNQISEKENKTDNVVVTYAYNDQNQIISAEEKKEGELTFSYVYEYNNEGYMSKITRKQEGEDDFVQTFEYDGKNVTKHKIVNDTYVSTFDDKNNPFIGIFPNAYGKILAGNYRVISVNENNFITKTGADAELVYEYNTDNYPLSYSYVVFGFATIKVTFEYF